MHPYQKPTHEPASRELKSLIVQIQDTNNTIGICWLDPFNEIIARILEACWKLGYFPERYKSAKTICLRKPNKGSYSQVKV